MSIDSILPLVLEYRYWILIPLSFVEGPVIGFIAGALSRLGYLNPFIAFFIFIVRDIILDAVWYGIGRWGGKTRFAAWFLRKIRITDEHLRSVRILWDTHPLRTMLIGKISYGIAHIFLVVAGMVDMPFGRFFRYATIVAFIQYGTIFILGYIFGNAFGTITGVISNIEWVIAALTLIITAYYVFTHYMRNKALDEEKKALEDKS